MSWLTYFIPRTILKTGSAYNRDIRIIEERKKYKLLVNGSRESGAYIEKLWQKALTTFGITERLPIKRILVLGVAGGTVIHLLNKTYPEATILGVDIDQTMINIGKRYFGLDRIANLSIVCQDAEAYIHKTIKSKGQFGLIIVDLFVGTHVPEFVRKQSFLEDLKTLLKKDGVVIINYLREFEYLQKSEILKKKLLALFTYVQEQSFYNNRFFMTR